MSICASNEDYCENWLGLCTPFMCMTRKDRSVDDSWIRSNSTTMYGGDDRGDDSYDSLERLGNIFDALFRLDRQVMLLRSQEAFVKSCLSDREQFNIKIIANGMDNFKELCAKVGEEHDLEDECLRDILSGLKLPKETKLQDAVRAISYHFINKMNSIQHDLQDALREYDALHKSTIDEFENMRRRFFNITLCRSRGERGIDFSISQTDFKFIVNSENDKLVGMIFSLLDDDGKGSIDWGSFELNSGRILTAAKDLL